MNTKTLLLSTALVLTPAFASASGEHHAINTDMAKMESHMISMEAEMQNIRAMKEPTARKQAMQKHMQGMMAMMQGMQSAPKMTGGSEAAQISHLSQRVDLLQAMVNQMVQSRAASYGIYPDSLSSALSDEEYKEK